MRYFQTVTGKTRKCNNLRVSLTVGRLTRNSRKALPFSTLGRILYNLYNQTNRHQRPTTNDTLTLFSFVVQNCREFKILQTYGEFSKIP